MLLKGTVSGVLWFPPELLACYLLQSFPESMKCNLEVKQELFGAMLFLLLSVSCRQTRAAQIISPDEVPLFNTEKMHIWSSLHFLKTVLLIWQYIFPQTKKFCSYLFILAPWRARYHLFFLALRYLIFFHLFFSHCAPLKDYAIHYLIAKLCRVL